MPAARPPRAATAPVSTLRHRAPPAFSPSIGDYALIGDCRCAALVSRDGSIDWLCLPHFSGAAVFAALLDRHRGGHFAVHPAHDYAVYRRYLGDTAVLETTFVTPGGTVRLTDAIPIAGEQRELQPQRECLRRIEVTSGTVDMEIDYAPRPDFGRAGVRLQPRGAFGWSCQYRNELFLLHSDIPLHPTGDGNLSTSIRLRAGDRRYLSLAYTQSEIGVIPPLGGHADERIAATLRWWRAWTDRCVYDGPYRATVLRSAVTLKLLAYALSGAVIAAPTTSLPEAIGGVRNWDYRYCWLRDASLTLRAFIDLGYHDEGDFFFHWLLYNTRLTWPRLQVLYDVYGESRIPESELAHFEGYRGSRPVRLGNGAWNQLQLDIYGAVAMAVHDFVVRGGRLEADAGRLLAGLGKTVCQFWREPDQGIWEIRGRRRHYTYSKLLCWTALDRLIRLHELGEVSCPVERFRGARHDLRLAIDTHGYNRRLGAYTSVFGGREIDASLLLMPHFGYLEARDPRMRGTFELIERHLTRGALVYRYHPALDGIAGGEGAFGICSFWAVEYLARAGEIGRAVERLEQMLAYANDLGLYAEEVEPVSGAALGNYPQAYTHVGLINAVLAIEAAQRTTAGRRRHVH